MEFQQRLVRKQSLSFVSMSHQLYMACEASKVAICACLYIFDEDGLLVLHGCFSRVLQKTETRYPVIDCELMAIVEGLAHFRHLHSDSLFSVQVLTDHRNLVSIQKFRLQKRLHWRWAESLTEQQFCLTYLKASDNFFADCLSRTRRVPLSGAIVGRQPLCHQVLEDTHAEETGHLTSLSFHKTCAVQVLPSIDMQRYTGSYERFDITLPLISCLRKVHSHNLHPGSATTLLLFRQISDQIIS